MTEAEITQALQKDLAYFKIKVAVRQRHNHLHVLLSRPEGTRPDYAGLTRVVRASLRGLKLPDMEIVTVYGRLIGQKAYEWEVSSNLSATDDLDRAGSTIFLSQDVGAGYLNDLQGDLQEREPVDANLEDAPTEIYRSPSPPLPYVPAPESLPAPAPIPPPLLVPPVPSSLPVTIQPDYLSPPIESGPSRWQIVLWGGLIILILILLFIFLR